MNPRGPFGGVTGLKIRLFGLAIFVILGLVSLATGDWPHVFYCGVYLAIGLFETSQYYRRM